jgi:maltose alpha-D-glucosyltransferase/alpha-amylase
MSANDPLWYKDAIFYELHVKSFQDSNDDGIGDFRGLISRLDDLQELGIDCIWLLPFYPSPGRDDGYDIAEFLDINPRYGTLADVRAFLDEAHRRGLRVIADLVLNHTSDQHLWFQRARRAPRGSPERDWYVWRDDDTGYPDARVIFTDTEPSNWSWDPVAGQYYWHRFFAHQPDLNWESPQVREAIFRVMEFWLEMGLDGFRADAVPYLIEREGTICENLPETHAILRDLRARIDARFPGRVLLAEANQWPTDVRPYFGDSDEFQMAFHFPLMPRIFMAVRQGIRTPIVEVIENTPAIPPDCQWCIFLRNHDELTLEMVTDEERDYLYREYAADPRMRLNLGIRRRLAPLLDGDRRKIELLNGLLLSMPGTPILYYGDEIGMGDNIWLGDRDGVRTPMQWSPDRNAGFSRAEPERLFLPVIADSVFGYQAINVDAQRRSPFSLLNWMKRLIQLRRRHPAQGRGSIRFLSPANPHILAYLREYEGDTVLVVANLAVTAQIVELDLSPFAGSVPVETMGATPFLRIGAEPYVLSLAPYGFFWFAIRPPAVAARGPGTGRGMVKDRGMMNERGMVNRREMEGGRPGDADRVNPVAGERTSDDDDPGDAGPDANAFNDADSVDSGDEILSDEEIEPLLRAWADAGREIFSNPAAMETLLAELSPEWLNGQRWFRSKSREVTRIDGFDSAAFWPSHGLPLLLTIPRVSYLEGEPEYYLLPLTPRAPAEDPAGPSSTGMSRGWPGGLSEGPSGAPGDTGPGGAGTASSPGFPREMASGGGPGRAAVLSISTSDRDLSLYDATHDPFAALALLELIETGAEVKAATGVFRGAVCPGYRRFSGTVDDVRPAPGEQSNTSIRFGDFGMMKLLRKLEPGAHPDLEVSRFLASKLGEGRAPDMPDQNAEAGSAPAPERHRSLSRSPERHPGFTAFPRLLGSIEFVGPGAPPVAVAALFEFIPNRGTGWEYATTMLARFFNAASRSAADPHTAAGRAALRRMAGEFFAVAADLGRVTADLHLALASAEPEERDFVPELIGADDIGQWLGDAEEYASGVIGGIARELEATPAALAPVVHGRLAALIHDEAALRLRLRGLRSFEAETVWKMRVHGDFHLSQLLRANRPEAGEERWPASATQGRFEAHPGSRPGTAGGDAGPGAGRGAGAGTGGEWVILDFEGEPARPLASRRSKQSPLRDLASMLRSFDYAMRVAIEEYGSDDFMVRNALHLWGGLWLETTREAFLDSYRAAIGDTPLVPRDPGRFHEALGALELEKAIHELGYEMNNRPDWMWVPLDGIRSILDRSQA